MNHNLIIGLIGIIGVLLILSGYYMLWIPPESALDEVLIRTRTAIVMNLIGAIALIYYLYKR